MLGRAMLSMLNHLTIAGAVMHKLCLSSYTQCTTINKKKLRVYALLPLSWGRGGGGVD